MNMNYGHLVNGKLVYAKDYAIVDGHLVMNPSAEMNLRCDPPEKAIVVPKLPAPPAGKHYEITGWHESETTLTRTTALVDNPPPPPRRWTKLAIETALAQADMLDAMDAFLEQTAIVGKLTAARAFSRCDYIEEGYPTADAWSALLDGAAVALGKSREEVNAFLDALPTETER